VATAVAVRMVNQGLATRPAADPRAAARACAGIQAQDLWASQLAVRARSVTARVDDVVTAAAEPTVARSWLMRGTLHMVAAEDLRWLVELIGPVVLRLAEPRFAALGLTQDLRDRMGRAVAHVLTGQRLTRAELVAALDAEVGGLPVEGQGPAHVTIWASASGLTFRAGDRGKEPTYALVDEVLPPAPPAPPQPMVELVRRYVRAFGPVTIEDFGTWSRLPLAAARRAFADLDAELQPVKVSGRTHYAIGDTGPAHRVLRLLPTFDSYLMGYRGRDAVLDPARRGDVAVGGILRPTIVVDGVIVGTWRLDRRKNKPLRLRADFFDRPAGWELAALEGEAADVGRFLNQGPVQLELAPR
jgi:Winged helix DNA-binding domain